MLLEALTAATLFFSPAEKDSTLQQRLVAKGYDEAVVEELFADEEPNQTVINLFSDNPEKDGSDGKLTQDMYNRIVGIPLLKDRIDGFIDEYDDTLDAIEQIYGVDQRYIAAIIGVETRFGTNTGDMDVTQTYKTIHDYADRRHEFAMEQAECLVELAEEYGAETVDEWEGSYAGAMGNGQFIPCSVQDHYIGDLDSMENTIESIANYLRNNKKIYPETGERATWNPAYNGEPLTEDTNYPAIWSYNHSNFYVRAIDELATSISFD